MFDALDLVREEARRKPLPPLTLKDMRGLGASLNPRKAKGIDVLGALDIRRRPEVALTELGSLIMAWESEGALPWQLLCNLISLLPKPQGGERCIGLVAWLVRFACTLRGHMFLDWASEAAGFGDDALKGSSALRAASLRAFGDEAVRALGGALVSVSILWDMAGFYDTIQPAVPLLDALGRGFPPQVLLLESLLHLAPRVLRDRDKSCSLPIHPERSIVAGVRGAVDMARCYLYSILEEAHARYFPLWGEYPQLGRRHCAAYHWAGVGGHPAAC